MKTKLLCALLVGLLGWSLLAATGCGFGCTALYAADEMTPAQAAESIRATLVQAQLQVNKDVATAQAAVNAAQATYQNVLMPTIGAAAPALDQQLQAGFSALGAAAANQASADFAAARADVWTTLLAASYRVVEQDLQQEADLTGAQQWLAVREFRTATRFSRPGADATLALAHAASGELAAADALTALRADLLDTYQARLVEALRNLATADARNFPARRAELAALAAGYFAILSPAYQAQFGEAKLASAQAAFANLRKAALGGGEIANANAQLDALLANFRAAPLSPSERARRAGQLLRYLGLVAVEYGRGVNGGQVTKALEIQEALTFNEGAQAAFTDLQDLLTVVDSTQTEAVRAQLAALDEHLQATSAGVAVAEPATVQAVVEEVTQQLHTLIPADWLQQSAAGDFDVIAAMLDQMENAVGAGDYALAESARLEAYAVMETGPEARLMIFAPQLKANLEEHFWNGQGEAKGLAYLIAQQAPLNVIKLTRSILDADLATAQDLVAKESAPAAVLTNATIIVFREGLEAVLILASLMGSMKLGESRRFRKPLWWGALLAFVATVLTWLLAREVLVALARYGEKLEAIVSLVAIAILLLITNWFFHKMYWNDWIASFHNRKRQLLSGEAGLFLGLLTLGFTSVYREGFETVLFLQALVLEAGATTVLSGVALGLAGTLLVGLVTFRIQARLPYKKMLIVTGVMIGGVLLMMVGTTVHVLQVVGWLPIHVITINLPLWLGTWLGLYPTWEGIGLQIAAALFVIGSYYWAEHLLHAKRPRRDAQAGGKEVVALKMTR